MIRTPLSPLSPPSSPSSRTGRWKGGRLLTAAALLLGLTLLFHAWIPNGWTGNLGSLVETVLPWLGLLVPVLLALAAWRRSATAALALLLPAVVWLCLFGGNLYTGVFGAPSQGSPDLTVVEQNINANNPDPTRTARALAATGADLLALVELTPQATGTYESQLAEAYPYHAVQGTVGLWSKRPLSDAVAIDVMDYGPLAARKPVAAKSAANRALRVTVATDRGPLTVYVAHLGSVRLMPRRGFWTASRDIGAQALGRAVGADPSRRVLLLGDLNGTTDDRALAPLTARLHSAQDSAGSGFGFTWPAAFPLVRLDQILVRGVTATDARVLPATGSDHLPVATGIRLT
ncbi:vancomycin resistance protein VanJ [Streptacidiphilus sp. MAP12-33]|uniref:endonuclease/exonuclease/phosphatase family protein n=1 Tax=Streptacidiphilus sp. MAP12-33 TaxID=3156266 RepID=UPI00351865D5